MALWGEDKPDAKDLLIETQADEIRYLRAKVDELQKELLAMTSSSAYRLVHRDQPDPPGKEPELTPIQLRGAIADKDQLRTVNEIMKSYPVLDGKPEEEETH